MNKTEKTEQKKTDKRFIGTTELTEIVNETLNVDFDGRRIRRTLRRIIPDDSYTTYRFEYPSSTVDRIISTLRNELTETDNRKRRSSENRKRRTERTNKPIISVDDSGNVSLTKSETETKSVTISNETTVPK